MKKLTVTFLTFISIFFAATAAFAENRPILNTINYQQQVEKWVTTDSADVMVSVNVTTKEKKFDALQHQVMKKLEELSDGRQWHIDSFSMSQDQSGLEVLSWEVRSRMPLALVNSLRQKIDSLSQAGQQYKIQNVDFEPSLVEKEKAFAELRQRVYDQVKVELDNLNKSFPNGHYFLHSIDFVSTALRR